MFFRKAWGGVGRVELHLEGPSINAGFEYAYQYPGINRVLQAAGRVIRSETDRGVVLLIDQRYATFRYRSLLHKQWTTISVQNHRQLAEELGKFWQAGK